MPKVYPRTILILFFVNISLTLFSQNIGINTTGSTPSVNAILDLNSGNKYNFGLIIPHVTLGASLIIFSPPIVNGATINDTGMMVYNMNGPQAAGYYYWNGTTWALVTSSGGGGGNVNACLTAGINYIPYFTSSTTICNSALYQASTTTTGLGTTSPKNMLDAKGAVTIGSYAGVNTAPANAMIVSGQVGIGNTTPASSAVVDITNTKAIGGTGAPLVWPTNPNPSANIVLPVLGEEIFNTTSGCFDFYNGTTWLVTGCPCTGVPSSPTITPSCSQSFQGSTITYTSSVTTGVTFTWIVTATTGTPIVTGNGTSSITVTWPSSGAGTGTVTLKLVNMCGTTTASLPVTISNPSITGTSTIYSSSTGNIYKASVAGATYTWSFVSNTNGSSIVGSATSQSVSISAGATAGTFALQCIISFGSCSVTVTYNVTVNLCGTIALDATGASGDGVKIFNITTNQPNDLVIVSCNGFLAAGTWTGSVAVSGGPTAALYISKTAANSGAAIYWFLAPTPTTYTVTVTEGGWTKFANFGIALTGFCSVPTAADFVASNSISSTCGGCASISTTLAETVGSYAFGSYTGFNNTTPPVPLWTNLTSISGTDDAKDSYGIAGQVIGVAGTPTITATQTNNLKDAVLILLDIH